MFNPQARQDDIVVQELFDELVIYDLKRDRVHALNPTAAFVWQHCNGSRTAAELTSLLHHHFQIAPANDLLELTLARLAQAHLLAENTPSTNGQRTLTRREALKLAGLTVALLPVVKSIVAPTAAQASSGDSAGAFCLDDASCCSGVCDGGTCQ